VAAPAPGPPLALVAGLGLIVVVVLVLWVRSLARLPRPVPPVSGTGPVTDESLPVSFGDYVLRRRIGKGGMAAVYEATKRGERLALKRPLDALLDDPRFRERFLREAELGRTLHHPNIVRIVDRGEIGEVPNFAMELVDGETLRDRLEREGPLDVREAARVTRQVAEALDYAHHKGVVHRDLKPSNIMLERTGAVKVMDYGIARALRLEGLTTTGFFLGTPEYAAPEAVEGTVQPRSAPRRPGALLAPVRAAGGGRPDRPAPARQGALRPAERRGADQRAVGLPGGRPVRPPEAEGTPRVSEWRLKAAIIYRVTDTGKLKDLPRKVFGS
jgi:serine/threonine protein kinase